MDHKIVDGMAHAVRDLWSNRRDWNFAKSGKLAAIFQKLFRSEDPAKRSSLSDSPSLSTKSQLLNLAYLQSADERKHFFSSRRHRQWPTMKYGERRVR
jgi:hypothetical protein